MDFKSNRAFTLIEVLVVLLIIVSIFAFVSRGFYSKEKKINTTFEQLIRLNRRIQHQSEVHHKRYRLVFQLNKDEPDEYWVEKEIKKVSTEEDSEKESSQDSEKENQDEFVEDELFFSEPQKIHPLLDITTVEFDREPSEDQEENNRFYIYYHPQALFQKTAIQISRSDHSGKWTLYLDPIVKDLKLLKSEKTLSQIKALTE